jgi:hypothetical protein
MYLIPPPVSPDIIQFEPPPMRGCQNDGATLQTRVSTRHEGDTVRLFPSALVLLTLPAFAQTPPSLLPQPVVAALANELSGETAKRNLEGLARFHRQRGSQGFHAAAELIAERARAHGLSHVEILKFPADGQTFYGTQKARRAWDAEEGELSELKDGAEVKMASYAAEPIVLPGRPGRSGSSGHRRWKEPPRC